MAVETPQPVMLDYAPAAPRRRWPRIAITVVVIAVAAFFGVRAFRVLATNARWMSQQRAWLASAPQAGSVVLADPTPCRFSESPDRPMVCGVKWWPDGKVLLAEMQTETGKRAIVGIEFRKQSSEQRGVAAQYSVFAEAWGKTALVGSTRGVHQSLLPGRLDFMTDKPLEVYAGVVDPNDRSHATIELRQSGKSQTIDVWLRSAPDGFVVKVEPRM